MFPTPTPNEDDPPPRLTRKASDLDMTPMVDVTFLLLIFFMVTASFASQRSVAMPRQTSERPSDSPVEMDVVDADPVRLEIDESGSFLVLAKDWERQSIGKQNLITTLKEAIGEGNDDTKLDIKVHENAQLQMLVDGIDGGTIAGFKSVQITQSDDFE